jgi:hypothetical protein
MPCCSPASRTRKTNTSNIISPLRLLETSTSTNTSTGLILPWLGIIIEKPQKVQSIAQWNNRNPAQQTSGSVCGRARADDPSSAPPLTPHPNVACVGGLAAGLWLGAISYIKSTLKWGAQRAQCIYSDSVSAFHLLLMCLVLRCWIRPMVRCSCVATP